MRVADPAHQHATSSEWWRVDGRTKTLMLEGWKALPPAPCEVVVIGLEPDTPYEAYVEAQTVRGFHVESPVSAVLQVGLPAAPDAPLLEQAGPGALCVRWVAPASSPPVERVLCLLRRAGDADADWDWVDNITNSIVGKDFVGTIQACPASPAEVVVAGLDPEVQYEAKCACLNGRGWSAHSPTSAPSAPGDYIQVQ
eukprot:6299786-Prymnesium_polylepis.1